MITLFDLSQLQIILYIVMIFIFITFISFIMEVYKKSIRNSKASRLEIYVVAAICSVLTTLMIIHSGMFHPVFILLGGDVLFDEILLGVLIYMIQLQADMKVLKKILKSFTRSILKKSQLSEEQIDTIMESIK